jgi:hypothetical protein
MTFREGRMESVIPELAYAIGSLCSSIQIDPSTVDVSALLDEAARDAQRLAAEAAGTLPSSSPGDVPDLVHDATSHRGGSSGLLPRPSSSSRHHLRASQSTVLFTRSRGSSQSPVREEPATLLAQPQQEQPDMQQFPVRMELEEQAISLRRTALGAALAPDRSVPADEVAVKSLREQILQFATVRRVIRV